MEGLQSLFLLLVLLYYFAHVLDSSCSGQSLLICVAGRSIFCGAFSNFPPLLPSTFQCLSVRQVHVFACAWGLMAELSGFARHWTQPPLSDAKFKLT